MDFIFQSCDRWHYQTCLNDRIRESFFSPNSGPGPLVPGDARSLRHLNEICAPCDFPLNIHQRECPVCGGQVYLNRDLPMIEVDSLKIYNYQCGGCRRELVAYFIL